MNIARWLLAAAIAVASSASLANIYTFTTTLLGSNESPPNASPATGLAAVVVDDVANTMSIHVTFSGLEGPTTASHIHCCTAAPDTGTAGVATQVPFFVGFPIGVTSGTYNHVFDLTLASTYNPSFVAAHGGTAAGAEAFLLAGMLAGESYLNVHTTFAPGGEIRGFLAIPEPATLALFAAGLVAAGVARRRAS